MIIEMARLMAFMKKCLNIYVVHVLFSIVVEKGVYGIHFPSEGKNITLEGLNVPEVLLTCPYQLQNEDKRGLVVSWYYSDLPYPIYQWIPPLLPQALGFLKNYIDLAYESSKEDFYRYRTLRILSPPTNITGKYVCRVSSFQEEKRYTICLIVFTIPETFSLDVERRSSNTVVVKCQIGSVYPQPNLFLYRSFQNKRISLSNSSLQTTWSRGTYNVSVEAEVKEAQLDGMTEFQCYLSVPDTNITMQKSIKYIPSISPSHHMYYGISSTGRPTCQILTCLATLLSCTIFCR